mmetsp:Transcript_25358/g.62406  ORF Transcript_25358/g.62406 Transcript_25358/m.62406 type:complete len:251 (+) Transcript_25358:771-1523(+)
MVKPMELACLLIMPWPLSNRHQRRRAKLSMIVRIRSFGILIPTGTKRKRILKNSWNSWPMPVDDLMDGMETFVKSALREEKKKGDPVDEFDIAEDKEMAEFYAFMRSELGDEEFEKTLTEEMSDEDKEFAKFFDFELDETDFGETLEDETKKVKKEALSFHPDSDGVALKLIALEFGDRSQSFQLVKLLQPFPLVGKKIEESAENGVRFELLTQQEEEILIPKLQATCQEDLQNAGLSFEKDFQPPAKSS